LHYAIDQTKRSEAATVQYLIDGRASRFTVQAFATGLLSTFGHSPTIAIPDFKGEVLVNLDALEQSSLRVTIRADSLTVTDDISGKDRDEIDRRMRTEVLESDSYPEIVYESSKVSASKTGQGQYWVALTGELTLRGITRSQAISARVSVNEDTLRATGDFSLRQSDYEISPVSAVGGTIKLKDELKFSFDISARKQ
jgi:polyisoprenoid-binding protein YceI